MGPQIGVAHIKVVPQSGAFGPTLTNQAGAAGKKAGSRFGSFFKSTAGKLLALGGGIFAAQKIFGFFKESLQGIEEANAMARKTEALIKATGGAANVSAKDITKLTDALELKTAVDGDIIRSGSNILLTFKGVRNEAGKNNDIFNQANSVMLDLAATTGQSVPSAATMLGKALQDPVRGLTAMRRVGVSFTEQQENQIKKMVESGNVLGAQKLILRELKSQYGGTAAAGATASEKLTVGWKRFQDSVGAAILPLWNKIVNLIVNTVLPMVTKAVEAFARLDGAGKNITKSFGALSPVIARVKEIFSTVSPVVMRFVSGAVEGIKQFINGLRSGENRTSSFANFIKSALPTIIAIFKGTFAVVKEVVRSVFDTIRGIVTAGVNFISGIWSRSGSHIMAAVRQAWQGIATFIRGILKVIQGVINVVLGAIRGDWSQAWKGIRQIFQGIWQAMGGLLKVALNSIRVAISTVMGAIQSLWSGAWGRIRTAISNAWKNIRATLQRDMNSIRTFINTAMNAVRNIITNIMSAIRARWSDAWTNIRRVVSDRISNIRTTISNGMSNVRTVWNNALTAIRDRASDIWNRLVSGFRNMRDGIGNAFSSVRDRVRGPINAVIGFINRLINGWNRLNNLWSGNDISPIAGLNGGGPVIRTGVSEFASGGAVPGPKNVNKDTVRALLTPGEHVLTKKEVLAAGGHDEIFAFRRLLLKRKKGLTPTAMMHVMEKGYLPPSGGDPRYAKGGAVGRWKAPRGYRKAVRTLLDRLRSGKSVAEDFSFRGMGKYVLEYADEIANRFYRTHKDFNWTNSKRTRNTVTKALESWVQKFAKGGAVASRFANAQHGKPYIWGGVGPRGYDCSGFMSAILNVLEGKRAHSRRFTTASIGTNSSLGSGIKKGGFSIGSYRGSPGHMAGTLGSTAVEAGGSPSFTKYNRGVASSASASRFTRHFHAKKGGGILENLKEQLTKISKGLLTRILNSIKSPGRLPGLFQGMGVGLFNLIKDKIFNLKFIQSKADAAFDKGGLLHPGITRAVNMTKKSEVIAAEGMIRDEVLQALQRQQLQVNVYIGNEKISQLAHVAINRNSLRNEMRARAGG